MDDDSPDYGDEGSPGMDASRGYHEEKLDDVEQDKHAESSRDGGTAKLSQILSW